MDLALDMGRTVAELGAMEEREFRLWNVYANKKMLPTRRLEFHLAQIALVIARTMGGSKRSLKLSDFLFDRPTEDEKKVTTPIAFFAVRKLGQGRKAN